MKSRRLSGRLVAIWIVASAVFASPAPSPLTNVDIVRLAARGVPEAEIIQTIREAGSTAFDLEPDMVVELRRAGVPQSVIDVMIEVQPRRGEDGVQPQESETVNLEVRFPGRDPADLEKNTASLPATDSEGKEVSIILYVACIAPTHVPDLWQSRTPLKEGFPRHRIIGLIEENVRESEKKRGRVHLVLPESVRMQIPSGPHQLQVGLAGRVGDEDWGSLGYDETTLDARPGEPALLEIKVITRGLKWIDRKSVKTPLHAIKIVKASPSLKPPAH